MEFSFAQLLRIINIFSVNAEGVQRCDKTVWRLKYNSTCRINTTFSWFVDFSHDIFIHSRPLVCKNLVLDLYCYRHSGIIISIQFKAWVHSHWKQSAHLLWFKRFYLLYEIWSLGIFHSHRWSLVLNSVFLPFILFCHNQFYFQAFP